LDTKNVDPDLTYDENAASVFWGLSFPYKDVPGNDGKKLPNKLDYCIDQLKGWDPR
jgi:hypothetical protein